jgi:1-deoxy-D-xylulose-5-phosphate reductoisomerase
MPDRQSVLLLGATGSIGSSTIDIIRRFPERFKLAGFSYHSNQVLAKSLAREFNCPFFCSSEPSFCWSDITSIEHDMSIQAIVGAAGVEPSVQLAGTGKKLLLANKESLVVAGELFNSICEENGTMVLPADSEHNSLYRLLQNQEGVKKLVLTASGGPLRSFSDQEMKQVTKSQVLNHPTWSMGDKITVDSAGLINKALEVMEAHYLFGLPFEKIDAVIHPQSFVHAAVQAQDGSFRLHVSVPDMKIPLAHGMFFPKEAPGVEKEIDLDQMQSFTFEKIDKQKFPGFKLGIAAGNAGGIMPMIFNAANEAANHAFRQDLISFSDIAKFIGNKMQERSGDNPVQSLDELLNRNTEYLNIFARELKC